MGFPPLVIDESVPGDSDIVSQFPAAERTFRNDLEDWLLIEHGTSGRHKIPVKTTAEKTAITNWEVGSLVYDTTLNQLQLSETIDPDVFVPVHVNAADEVTFDMIQNLTTDRLLGRDTAGSGSVEELALTAPLVFTGSGGIDVSAATTSAEGVAELATQAEAQARSDTTRVVTPASLADFSRIKTGTYTGDGATSQAITGVGFQPKFVLAIRRVTSDDNLSFFMTTDTIVDDIAAGAAILVSGGTVAVQDNRIIALGADGFTVDDNGGDEDPNASGVTYNYIALG